MKSFCKFKFSSLIRPFTHFILMYIAKQLKFLNKLMPSSWHTPHTFKGVSKGLAPRIGRIFSSPMLYQEQILRLKTQLCKGGYEAPKVQASTGCQTKIHVDRLVTEFQWSPHTTQFCRISTLFWRNISPFITPIKKWLTFFKSHLWLYLGAQETWRTWWFEPNWKTLYPMVALKPVQTKMFDVQTYL